MYPLCYTELLSSRTKFRFICYVDGIVGLVLQLLRARSRFFLRYPELRFLIYHLIIYSISLTYVDSEDKPAQTTLTYRNPIKPPTLLQMCADSTQKAKRTVPPTRNTVFYFANDRDLHSAVDTHRATTICTTRPVALCATLCTTTLTILSLY